ncbi:MAG: hypothetical protein JWR69_3137 [Pedosphaera sp.]|nr:hypothetical protein [Pedosphaera sp.]
MNNFISSRLIRSASLLLVSVALGGCGLVHAKQDADKVLARHFQAIATNGFDAAMADYAPKFFQKTSKDEWTKSLSRLGGKLGTYQSYSITGFRANQNAGTFGSGTTITLQCQIKYSKYPATETFTLFKGLTDSDYKIVNHSINSDGFLKE